MITGFVKGISGESDSGADIGTWDGDGIGIEGIEGFEDSGMVEGKWALEEGGALERDDANAVALNFVKEVDDSEFSALKAVRFDILGEHAFGAIDGEEDIDAFGVDFFPGVAPLGAGEGEDSEGNGEGEEGVFKELFS